MNYGVALIIHINCGNEVKTMQKALIASIIMKVSRCSTDRINIFSSNTDPIMTFWNETKLKVRKIAYIF